MLILVIIRVVSWNRSCYFVKVVINKLVMVFFSAIWIEPWLLDLQHSYVSILPVVGDEDMVIQLSGSLQHGGPTL